ncbi:MAG TPA: hypothetical protein VKX16_17375 [Chloroflexota bacterium]|nr:hypothetical protein [Chloroflexota bacterium]
MADSTVIYAYTLEQAIDDGVLVEVFAENRPALTGGKPIVATHAVHEAYTEDELAELWNRFRDWEREVMPGLPEEEQLFSSVMNGETVWVLEDGQAFTILFPDDY